MRTSYSYSTKRSSVDRRSYSPLVQALASSSVPFKKSKCRISGKIGFFEMGKELSIDIDTKSDLLQANQKFFNI